MVSLLGWRERAGGNAQPAQPRVAGCEKIYREKPTAARGFSRIENNCHGLCRAA